METTAVAGAVRQDSIVVNQVGLDRPLRWLALGWQDLLRARGYSLAYGAAIVLISLLLTYTLSVEGWGFLVPFLAAGFYLLAPIIALGLYEMSARLERGEALQFCHAREAWRRNQSQIGIVTAGLLIIMQLWIAANFLLFALLYNGMQPPLDRFFSAVLLAPEGRAFTLASVVLGLVLAWVSYAISAISIPLLMDRKVDGFTAIRTSVQAVVRNWPAMTLWAALIVLFAGLGLATFYVGLAVAMPLLGHATWHAYRDLIPRA
ncbi:MAG: DUF2189 domain-containing protein [Bdellovibrio bacteriovorus]